MAPRPPSGVQSVASSHHQSKKHRILARSIHTLTDEVRACSHPHPYSHGGHPSRLARTAG